MRHDVRGLRCTSVSRDACESEWLTGCLWWGVLWLVARGVCDADYNPTHPAMGSTPVQLLPTVTYAYSAALAPGLVLNWNVVGSRLDFQAVYSGVAW